MTRLYNNAEILYARTKLQLKASPFRAVVRLIIWLSRGSWVLSLGGERLLTLAIELGAGPEPPVIDLLERCMSDLNRPIHRILEKKALHIFNAGGSLAAQATPHVKNTGPRICMEPSRSIRSLSLDLEWGGGQQA